MNNSVTVLLENGRRQRVAVKPNTPILLVLEEVCKKQGLNSDDYDLKFHNRILDLASTIQFCGISNNAPLELVPATKSRVESPVAVFLQLEDGNRLSGSFLPSCTLWDVINQLCNDEIKAKENPVIIYTRQEVLSDKLKNTTLKMLGLTGGNALLRLLHRTKEQLRNQSVSSVYKLPPKPKPVEKENPEMKKLPATDVTKETPESKELPAVDVPKENKPSNFENKAEKPSHSNIPVKKNTRIESEEVSSVTKMDVDTENETNDPVINTKIDRSSVTAENNQTNLVVSENADEEKSEPFNINEVEFVGDRYALLFKLDTMQSPKFEDQSDDFYELTIEDAKALLRDIKRTRSELEETELETSAIKARKKSLQLERKLTLYPHCVIRVIFPNRIVLQGIFKSSETVLEVINFTKNFLETPSLDFYLYVAPPKTILINDQKLVEIGAVPGINLYFGSESIDYSAPNNFLQEKFIRRLVSPNVAFRVANHFRKTSKKNKESASSHLPEIDQDAKRDLGSNVRPAVIKPTNLPKKNPSGKVPKWFKQP